jgi:hypothetical protein
VNRRLREEGLGLLLLALGVAGFLFESWELQPQFDDAYISYRYAANLVEGHGLVFNIGEYVEGFTNLLWTLLVAGGIALGFEANVVAHALGLASGVAVLAVTYVYARTQFSSAQAWIAALPVWIVVCFTSFARWSTSGLETPLFAASVTAALAALARGRIGWATAGVSLATLTRPEGAIVAAVVFGFHLAAAWRSGWRAWTGPLAYAVLLVLLTVFRLAYYGSPVPNTFYAKVPGVPIGFGLHYFLAFLRDGAAFLLVPAAIAAIRERLWRPGAAFIAAVAVYVVYVGGDTSSHFRFFVPVLPCLALLSVRGAWIVADANRYLGVVVSTCIPAAISWQVLGSAPVALLLVSAGLLLVWAATVRVERRWIARAASIALAGAVGLHLVGAFSTTPGQVERWSRTTKRAQSLERVRNYDRFVELRGKSKAEVILGRGGPVPLVAATGIGSFGYYSRLPIVDILGLADATVARSESVTRTRGLPLPGHQRSNADYILSRRPDYILTPKRGSPSLVRAAHDIWAHPDFNRYYELDRELGGYRRRLTAE